MKIILLSTGRGLRPEVILDFRSKLGLRDSDVLCLISWHPPRIPLPVDRHLVLGPQLRLVGDLATVHLVERRPELFSPAANAGRDPSPAGSADSADSASSIKPASAPGAAGTPAQLPVFHPRRLRKAVAWRVRRLKKAARTHTPTAVTGVRAHPVFRKVRNRLSPGASVGFASTCLWSSKVHAMTRDTDLVVALDAASQRGAWTLAKRVNGPDVVIGIPAAKLLLDQREASAPS